jgi:RimJ/RimL family protein N-acetyltransferase
MRLRNVTGDDLDLYIGMFSDPSVMAELGGPLSADEIREKLQGDATATASDGAWVLAILPDETAGRAVGNVSIWQHERDGVPVVEMGWMLLREFHGRGYGSEAVHLTLLRALAEDRWRVIHAFPGITNPASNAMCRKNGFTMLGETEVDYRGHVFSANHWRIDLADWDPRAWRG